MHSPLGLVLDQRITAPQHAIKLNIWIQQMFLPFTPWTLPVYPFPRSPSSHLARYYTKAPNQNLLSEDPKLASSCGYWVYQNHLGVFITLQDMMNIGLVKSAVIRSSRKTTPFTILSLSFGRHHFLY